jgi:hypothetical protein
MQIYSYIKASIQGDFMKKQVAVIVSFSALLTLSAFAPKVLWQEKHYANRFPASEEAVNPSEKPLDKNLQEKIEIKKEEFQISCLKDKQPSALEDEIKKLMVDKEAIIKEIADLKKEKEEPVSEKKEKIEVSRFTDKEDFVTLVSQMTSLMITQQQQQQMLMEQMFTMMSQMQQMQMPQHQQVNSLYPYSLEGGYPQAQSGIGHPSMFQNSYNIGLQHGAQVSPEAQAYQNPYVMQMDHSQLRAPSAQYETSFLPRAMNMQPQLQSHFTSGANYGFDFSISALPQDMERVQF